MLQVVWRSPTRRWIIVRAVVQHQGLRSLHASLGGAGCIFTHEGTSRKDLAWILKSSDHWTNRASVFLLFAVFKRTAAPPSGPDGTLLAERQNACLNGQTLILSALSAMLNVLIFWNMVWFVYDFWSLTSTPMHLGHFYNACAILKCVFCCSGVITSFAINWPVGCL